MLVAATLWIVAVLAEVVTDHEDRFLYVPYRDYATTVTMTERRGSGCGKRAEIWDARDLAGDQVEVCDLRFLTNADEGDIVRVGTQTIRDRVSESIVVIALISAPALLVMWIALRMLRSRPP